MACFPRDAAAFSTVALLLVTACATLGDPFAKRCPAAVEGVKVESAELPSGAALVFTGPPATVDELRRRAREMAQAYREQRGIHSDPRITGFEFVPARARAEDVDGGARVVLVADGEGEVEKVRTAVREWEGRMRALHGCPIAQGGGGMAPHPW